MLELAVTWLLEQLAAPRIGLTSVLVVSFISATLLPMGSEPTVFAVIKANEALFWPVLLTATFGNTAGGAVNYWIGHSARQTFDRERRSRWFHWLERFGPRAMLVSWLPVVGDPMCTLAGWARLPFWPSVLYMAIGKFLRYLCITTLLLYIPDSFWHGIAEMLG